jgi:flagellin
VRAIVGPTVITASSLLSVIGTDLNESEYITINNEKISGFHIEDNDASGALVDAINSAYDKTGVTANINARGVLVLTAEDGRNIDLSFSSAFLANDIGFDAGTGVDAASIYGGNTGFIATGKITLQSTDLFEVYGDSGVIGFANTGVYGVNSESSVSTINVDTKEGAVKALDVVDLALEHVSYQRAHLGALQSKLESTINNLSTTSENLSAARSRILDADFATETASLSRNQIIQQAGVSILSQANQSSQIALSLLG